MMSASTRQVREDFDRIALLTAHGGAAAATYHGRLLSQLPPGCESVLEVGCGLGSFMRRLSPFVKRVVGLDLSPQMIRLARERSAGYSNLDYLLGDFLQLSLPAESFDCVVSLATLHHIPLSEALEKMKSLLKPGGALVLHDLLADEGLWDKGRSAIAVPVNVALRFWKTGRPLPPREVRRAWAEHGKHDVYLTTSGVRRMCEQHLPGAKIRRHLLWRYTVVWKKP